MVFLPLTSHLIYGSTLGRAEMEPVIKLSIQNGDKGFGCQCHKYYFSFCSLYRWKSQAIFPSF